MKILILIFFLSFTDKLNFIYVICSKERPIYRTKQIIKNTIQLKKLEAYCKV